MSDVTFKIKDALVVHRQIAARQQVRTSFGAMDTRHAVLLLIRDESGLTGVGESWVNFPRWAPWDRIAAFEYALIPYLRGKKIVDIPSFMKLAEAAFRGPSVQAGALGSLLAALCAVELALWDIAAQRKRVPLNEFLFKRPASRVRVYGSGINHPIPYKLIDELLEKGVELFKLKLGFGDKQDRENIRNLQKHLGENAKLAVDVNRGWSFAEALRWLPFLNEHEVQWLEEPLRPDEEVRLGELQSRHLVPIAAGENVLMGPEADPEQIAKFPVDILQPDITKYSSLSTVLSILKTKAIGNKRVIPHFLGSAPGLAASLHLASGCKECLVEWDVNANPLRTDLFKEPFAIENGRISIPERPGLGWSLSAKSR